ncbi:MAG: hypothetical protein R3B47_13955 [Bacteroidia bacterium]
MWATLASGYATTTSALALDVGAAYSSKSKLFMAGFTIKATGPDAFKPGGKRS